MRKTTHTLKDERRSTRMRWPDFPCPKPAKPTAQSMTITAKIGKTRPRDFHSRLFESSVPTSEIHADNIHEESDQRTFDRLSDQALGVPERSRLIRGVSLESPCVSTCSWRTYASSRRPLSCAPRRSSADLERQERVDSSPTRLTPECLRRVQAVFFHTAWAEGGLCRRPPFSAKHPPSRN